MASRRKQVRGTSLRHFHYGHHWIKPWRIAPYQVALFNSKSLPSHVADGHMLLIVVEIKTIEIDTLAVTELLPGKQAVPCLKPAVTLYPL
jgi:hypothetical protein